MTNGHATKLPEGAASSNGHSIYSSDEWVTAATFLSRGITDSSISVSSSFRNVFTELVRGDVFYWGPLMAGALLGSIPVALVYSMFVEHYVTALTGAVKG